VDLQLSGHTHARTNPPNGLDRVLYYKYPSGLFEKNGAYIYTTSGTGIWALICASSPKTKSFILHWKRNRFYFASGGQGGSFRENRPLDPVQKLFITLQKVYILRRKAFDYGFQAGSRFRFLQKRVRHALIRRNRKISPRIFAAVYQDIGFSGKGKFFKRAFTSGA